MEAVKRKTQNYQSKSRGGEGLSDLASSKNLVSKEPEFKYGLRLMLGMLPSIGVIFAFGGRASLIALCFGSFIGYIMDLLGAVEGTVMCLVVTLIAIWATIVWSARLLLLETFANFSMVFVLGIVLIYVCFAFAGAFRTLRMEFEGVFYIAETVMFFTLPLLASCISTWFLSVELPSVDLPTCFSFCYFVYLVLFGAPLQSSMSYFVTNLSPESEKEDEFILSIKHVKIMYALPVILAPIFYLIVHRNILAADWETIGGILESVVFSILLVTIAAERQLVYWPSGTRLKISSFLANLKLQTALLMVLFLQRHPLFDDIKSFAGLSRATSSVIFCSAAVFLFAAVYIFRKRHEMDRTFSRLLTNAFVGIAAMLLGILLDLLEFDFQGITIYAGLPVLIVGAVSIADYYNEGDIDMIRGGKQRSPFYEEGLILFGCICTIVTVFLFSSKTLNDLSFTFHWGSRYFSLTLFCRLECLLAGVAVIGPALASRQHRTQELGYVSGSMRSGDENYESIGYVKGILFVVCFQSISIIVAIIELIVREQDWQDHGVKPGAVYPSYLLAVTAGILVITTYHLYTIGHFSFTNMWVVLLVQLCKLAHLLGLPSGTIFTLIILLLAYSMPIVLNFQKLVSVDMTVGRPKRSDSERINIVPLIGYLMLSLLATFWASGNVIPIALTQFGSKSPSDIQIFGASLALWLLHAAGLVQMFWKEATMLRSAVLLVSGFCILLSAEALGPLSVALDPTSSTYLVVSLHPELAQGDHSGLFLLVAAMLVVTAFFGMFPIHRPMPRIFFAVALAYCTAHAVLGAAFPASMGADSPHSGTFELPWMYSFVFSLLSISTALRAMAGIVSQKKGKLTDNESLSKNYVFLAWTVCPLVTIAWAVVEGSMREHILGIMWVATAQFTLTAIAVRARSLHAEFFPVRGAVATVPSADLAPDLVTLLVCSSSAILAFVWGFIASILSPHVANDISIPLLSLLVILTSKNSMIIDISSVKTSCIISCSWWTFSALYATLIKGLFSQIDRFDAFHLGNSKISGGLFGDGEISFWMSDSIWVPSINLILIFVPLPAIIMSVTSKKGTTEDMMFILAIISSLSIIGSNIWSIRFLGLLGLLMGTQSCNEIGNNQKISNRII